MRPAKSAPALPAAPLHPSAPPPPAAQRGCNAIHIYPLGGLGEVGKNMTVYECCGDMIIVDCGLVFPDNDMFGVDMVIPDFTFVVQNKDKIKGLLITHGHEDHIGSIPYLLQKFDLPIYGTRLTCGLIRNKLEEFGLAGKTKFVEITPRQKLKLGCFTVEPIHVNHSIPDAVAFAIDSPAGTIIQTGDFKIDYTPLACGPTDLATLSEYGQKGVLALLSDSTNAERPASPPPSRRWPPVSAACLPGRRTSASSLRPSRPTSTVSSRSSTSPWRTAARWPSAAAAWSTIPPWLRSWAICTSRKAPSSASMR